MSENPLARFLLEAADIPEIQFLTMLKTETGFDCRRFTRDIVAERDARITELEAQLTEARNTERAAVVAYLEKCTRDEWEYAASDIARGDHVC
jgi:hypothetical protein